MTSPTDVGEKREACVGWQLDEQKREIDKKTSSRKTKI
jgi:hypothetical protein